MAPSRFSASWKEEARHFLSLHYFAEAILASSFFVLHTIDPLCSYLFESCSLDMREYELLMFLGCVVAMKNRKMPTARHFFRTLFLFSKVLCTFLYFRVNLGYAILYALLCLAAFIFIPEPVYKGPEKIVYFRANSLKEELARDTNTTWLVTFYAAWSPPCNAFAPFFSQLSEQYATKRLKFGKIDAARYPAVAQEFGIDTATLSRQLPTVVLFKGGKEAFRRPFTDVKGRTQTYIWTAATLVKDFDLDALYEECSGANQQPEAEKKTN